MLSSNQLVIIVVIGVYLAILIGVAFWGRFVSKKFAPGVDNFYLAGRSLVGVVLLFTIFATQYSGNTQVGYAANGYREGFLFLVAPAFFVAVVGFTVLYAPKLRRLATSGHFVTPGDYIWLRFQSQFLTRLVGVLMVLASINFILTNVVAVAIVLETITAGAIPFVVGVVLISLVVVTYESLGGLRAVAFTDLLQGLLLLFGGVAFFVTILILSGGFDQALSEVRVSRPEFFSLPSFSSSLQIFSAFILVGLGGSIYPQLMQRIYAAKSTGALRVAFIFVVALPFITVLPAVLWGVLGNALLPNLASPTPALDQSENITPLLLNYAVSEAPYLIWVVVVMTLGLVGAVMSTIDSILLTATSIINRDIIDNKTKEGFVRNPKQKKLFGKLPRAQSISVLVMALVVAIAIFIGQNETIWTFIQLKFALLLPSAPAFYLGIRWRSLRAPSVVWGLLVGLGLTLGLYVADVNLLGIHEGVWGLLANLVVVLLLHYYKKVVSRGGSK